LNNYPLVIRRKADRRRTQTEPLDVVRYEVIERTLTAAYHAAPLAEGFNDWVCTVAADETHPHQAAAAEYCDLWRRHVVH
jgi:hypothetical protein